ncbi:MAG TPA: FAD:protein FMN transferase [Solirubrobacteraceae bacterium]|jgi:thiamine biosynthesis lipoprotein|nr:FAD:protein FMN transferase [Solirubrobacteraceae bacterium]
MAALAQTRRARWQALGTSAELLVRGDERELALARTAVERWLEKVDLACSRFRADSELSHLNAAGGRAVSVSSTLIEATQLALRAARLTDGDVDPTLGEALERAGYDRDWALIQADPDRAAPAPRVRMRRRPRWSQVRVDAARGTLSLPCGVKLDLGATAKAWAADRAADAARAACGRGVLVSLGGDIATCGDCPPAGWRVHVTDDHRDGPNSPGQTVTIRGGGLATSSTAVRRWRLADRGSRRSPIGGESMHHIIDPATGAPAHTPWRTVSVAAASCADANIAATAAIVRGERAAAWLSQAGLPARLVANDGETTAVGAWPEEREDQR